jgi:hypothetical protein
MLDSRMCATRYTCFFFRIHKCSFTKEMVGDRTFRNLCDIRNSSNKGNVKKKPQSGLPSDRFCEIRGPRVVRLCVGNLIVCIV